MEWNYSELIASIRTTSDPFIATGINAFGNNEIIDNARTHIDTELRMLSGAAVAMRELKYRRNKLALISRLPPEMLSKIFLLVRALAETSEETSWRSVRLLNWIKVTHVCRYWREVAINFPILWNEIDVTKSQWVLEMLGRSKLAPLDITAMAFPVGKNRDNEVILDRSLLLTMGHISRIRNLHIRASSRIVNQVLSSMYAAAPALESLLLASMFGPSIIPACMFDYKVPRLRQLTVEYCDGFWHLPLENLTELTIHFPHGRSMSISPKDFLRKISTMPLLETLDVMNHWSSRFSEDSSPPLDCVIPLQFLRKLTIISEISHCALLLHCLSFPITASVKLQDTGESSEPEIHHSTILSVLEQRYGRGNDHDPWLTVNISNDPLGDDFRFQAWSICCSDDEILEKEVAALDISSTSSGSEIEDIRVITALCSLRPLGQVGVLKLENFQLPNTSAAEILTGFKGVHTLSVSGGPAYPLVRTLIAHKPGRSNQSQECSSILFPNLHTVEFRGSDLESTYCDLLDRKVHLQEFLIKRRRRKVKLKLLRLRECHHVNKADVDRMRKLVNMVEWDGYKDEDEDDSDEGVPVLFSRQESVEI